MNRDEVSAATHGDLPFANPLAPATIERAIVELGLPAGARVLDIGAGRGQLLSLFGDAVVTVAVEPAAQWAAAARERGIDVVHESALADAPLDPPYDAVCCIASSHAFGTWEDALRGMRELAPVALVGEGFWQREPSAGYLDVLGATADELPSLDGLLRGARDAGWQPVGMHAASGEDWARYEETLIANGERVLAADPDPDLRAWVDAARARWEHPDGRDTLGFCLLTLRSAPADAQPGPD